MAAWSLSALTASPVLGGEDGLLNGFAPKGHHHLTRSVFDRYATSMPAPNCSGDADRSLAFGPVECVGERARAGGMLRIGPLDVARRLKRRRAIAWRLSKNQGFPVFSGISLLGVRSVIGVYPECTGVYVRGMDVCRLLIATMFRGDLASSAASAKMRRLFLVSRGLTEPDRCEV